MTKKEKQKLKETLERSNRAIEELNDLSRIRARIEQNDEELNRLVQEIEEEERTKKVRKLMKGKKLSQNYENTIRLLKKHKIPYEEGSVNGITSYIKIHFGDNGEFL